jgi:hypothetical protein
MRQFGEDSCSFFFFLCFCVCGGGGRLLFLPSSLLTSIFVSFRTIYYYYLVLQESSTTIGIYGGSSGRQCFLFPLQIRYLHTFHLFECQQKVSNGFFLEHDDDDFLPCFVGIMFFIMSIESCRRL